MSKNKIFTVDGSIGAGKTTLLKAIEERNHPDIMVLYEPVDEWLSIGKQETGVSLFELYYKDKQRYGFLFQMCALETRIKNLMECVKSNPGKIILTERSYITDYEIFAKMLHAQGLISPVEYMVYKKWFDLAESIAHFDISGIVYLDVAPYECVSRIAKRDRKGEGGIDFNYLKTLAECHEDWIAHTTLPLLKTHAADADAVIQWVLKQTFAG